MAKKMIAFCGLDCAACPALYGAKKLSIADRQKVADEWSKQFNASFKAEDIDCVGCTVREGKHVGYCSMCEIRLCGLGKGVSTCADCPEYACAKLEGFFKNAPAAKENLAALRV